MLVLAFWRFDAKDGTKILASSFDTFLLRFFIVCTANRSDIIFLGTYCCLCLYKGMGIMLRKAVANGLLVNTVGSSVYSFAHDRIQETGEYHV